MTTINMTGNIANEYNFRSTKKADGTKVLIGSFRVACNKGTGDTKKTVFVETTVFGNYAKSLSNYLKKGMRVTVVGDWDYFKPVDVWTYNGQTYSAIRVVASQVDFSGNRKTESEASADEVEAVEAVEIPEGMNAVEVEAEAEEMTLPF